MQSLRNAVEYEGQMLRRKSGARIALRKGEAWGGKMNKNNKPKGKGKGDPTNGSEVNLRQMCVTVETRASHQNGKKSLSGK